MRSELVIIFKTLYLLPKVLYHCGDYLASVSILCFQVLCLDLTTCSTQYSVFNCNYESFLFTFSSYFSGQSWCAILAPCVFIFVLDCANRLSRMAIDD